MAALRAPTMAARIFTVVKRGGTPPAASTAASRAKGSAKRVCENLIISRVVRTDRASVKTASAPGARLNRLLPFPAETLSGNGQTQPAGRAHTVGIEQPFDRRLIDVEGGRGRHDHGSCLRRAAHVLDVNERVGRLAQRQDQWTPLLQ